MHTKELRGEHVLGSGEETKYRGMNTGATEGNSELARRREKEGGRKGGRQRGREGEGRGGREWQAGRQAGRGKGVRGR